MGKKFTALLLAVILSFFVILPTIGQAQSEIERLTKEIEELQRAKQQQAEKAGAVDRKISRIESQQKEISKDIMALDLQMSETQAKINELDKQITKTTTEAKKAAQQLEEAKQRVEERDSLLKARVRMMYKAGEISYLEVLLGSKGFGDFIQRLRAVKLIVESDIRILEENKKDQDLITAKKQEIDAQLRKLEGLFAEAEALKQELKTKRKQKTVVIASLKEKESELENIKEKHEEAMLELAANAAAKVKQLEKLYYKGGKFIWPLPGYTRLSSGFGYRKDPFTGERAGHKGLDIPAPSGTDIKSAENGVVIVAGYVRGYGYTVIIEHGGGLRTLYAHGLRNGIQVKVGETVKKGQKIHEVGSTGRSTGPHLHFGVYKNNAPVNPYNYLN